MNEPPTIPSPPTTPKRPKRPSMFPDEPSIIVPKKADTPDESLEILDFDSDPGLGPDARMIRGQRRKTGNPHGVTLYDDEQRAKIIEWICEGCSNREIDERLRRRGWPICNWNNLARYRKKYDIVPKVLKELAIKEAMQKGYAQRIERVAALQRMAMRLENIIETELVTEKDRWIGPAEGGRFIVELEVNSGLLREFRQILKQIAQEVGDLSPDFLIGTVLNALPEHIRAAVVAFASRRHESGGVGATNSSGPMAKRANESRTTGAPG